MAMESEAPWHLKSVRKHGQVLELGDNYTISRSKVHPKFSVMFIGSQIDHAKRIGLIKTNL